MDPISAAVLAVVGIGSAISAWVSHDNAEKKRKYDLEMWEKEKEWQNEMMEKEIKYNSPEKQIERLEDAGLNPYTFLGSDAAGSFPSYQIIDAPEYTEDTSVIEFISGLTTALNLVDSMQVLQKRELDINLEKQKYLKEDILLDENIKNLNLDNEIKQKKIDMYNKELFFMNRDQEATQELDDLLKNTNMDKKVNTKFYNKVFNTLKKVFRPISKILTKRGK